MKRIILLLTAVFSMLFMNSCFTTSSIFGKDDQKADNSVEEQLSNEETASEENVSFSTEENEEYLRSVADIQVSRETFISDKREILQIISELSDVMENEDYSRWITYIDQDSISYWSQSTVLQKAASRLPVKGLKLSSLRDYFYNIFIPSRKGKDVDEIRYLTTDTVKAVHVNGDTDVVYYTLYKIDGVWKIHLPKLNG